MTELTKADIAESIISCEGHCLSFKFDCLDCPLNYLCKTAMWFNNHRGIKQPIKRRMKIEAAKMYLEETRDETQNG